MEFKKDGEIAVISFNKDYKCSGNYFSYLVSDFTDACTEIATDKQFKVLVIIYTGNWNIETQKPLSPSFEGGFARQVAGLDIPVLMGMDGYILGRFLELALACDIRFATPESYFGFTEIEAGLMPCDGGTQRLSRIVGKAKALEMLLTGELLDSKNACQTGLITRIPERDELCSEVMSLARKMSSKSPTSLVYAKEAINKGMDLSLEQGLRLEADLYFLMHTTNDRREGINAFKEKRKPKFNGS